MLKKEIITCIIGLLVGNNAYSASSDFYRCKAYDIHGSALDD